MTEFDGMRSSGSALLVEAEKMAFLIHPGGFWTEL
jgi:hypothetical protein